MELKRTFLVQRAETNVSKKVKGDTLSFGGGLRHGGLELELSNKLNEILNFEYMGSAEFELGVLRDSITTIIRNYDNYTTTTVFKEGKTIYVICKKSEYVDIRQRVEELIYDESGLREPIDLKKVLNQNRMEKTYPTTCWFELDNDFIFTIDPMIKFKLEMLFKEERQSQQDQQKKLGWFGKLLKTFS